MRSIRAFTDRMGPMDVVYVENADEKDHPVFNADLWNEEVYYSIDGKNFVLCPSSHKSYYLMSIHLDCDGQIETGGMAGFMFGYALNGSPTMDMEGRKMNKIFVNYRDLIHTEDSYIIYPQVAKENRIPRGSVRILTDRTKPSDDLLSQGKIKWRIKPIVEQLEPGQTMYVKMDQKDITTFNHDLWTGETYFTDDGRIIEPAESHYVTSLMVIDRNPKGHLSVGSLPGSAWEKIAQGARTIGREGEVRKTMIINYDGLIHTGKDYVIHSPAHPKDSSVTVKIVPHIHQIED